MLLMIALVILVRWLLGFVALPAAGAMVHVLLVIALIVIVAHFLGSGRGRHSVQRRRSHTAGESPVGVAPTSVAQVRLGMAPFRRRL